MKTQEEIQAQLVALKKKLQTRYPIGSLALFGSYARDEQHSNSDIDLLVELDGKVGTKFILLAEEMEDELGRKIDLVSKNGLKEKYFNRIKANLNYV